MQSSYTFDLDGETIRVAGEPVFTTLADYLDRQGYGRERRFAQAESALGGAPLLLLDVDPQGRPALRSVDASLLLLPTVAGRRFWSAEGLALAAQRGRSHPALDLLNAQPDVATSWKARAQVITALIEAWHRPEWSRPGQITDHFDGCLSRSIHYGGLRDLAQSILPAPRRAAPVEPFASALSGVWPDSEEFSYVDSGKRRFYRPHTLVDLTRLLSQFPKALLIGGSAGLAHGRSSADLAAANCLIATDGVPDLRTVFEENDRWLVGSAVTLTGLGERLGDACPLLAKVIRRLGTRPHRNRATLGGCLASARPDDPLAPAIIALDAVVRVVSHDGERDIPVSRFFEGQGRTNLRPGEVIAHLVLPKFTRESLASRGGGVLRLCDAYLASPRRTDAPATLSAAFAVELDVNTRITQAILAYAGIGDRPLRAREAEKALIGRFWSEETIIGILGRVSQEIEGAASTTGGAPAPTDREKEYRRQLIITLLQKFFYQHATPGRPAAPLGVVGDYLAPKRLPPAAAQP